MTSRKLAVSAAVLLGLLAGCGNAPEAAAPDAPLAAIPFVAPTPEPTPEATSGPLTAAALPKASVLGAKWKSHVQPGGSESGVISNGSTAQKREIDDLVAGLTPIGCPVGAVTIALPRPSYALEGSYLGPAAAPGVGLVLQFAKTSGATEFLTKLEKQVDACPAGKGEADGPVTLGFDRMSMPPGRLAAVRAEVGASADPNRYLVVAARDGNRVGILYVAGAKGAERERIGKGLAAALEH